MEPERGGNLLPYARSVRCLIAETTFASIRAPTRNALRASCRRSARSACVRWAQVQRVCLGSDGVPPPGSIGLHPDRGNFARSPAVRSGAPFPAIPNHCVADDEEFPHCGDGNDLGGFPRSLESIRELRQGRIAADRREGCLDRDIAPRIPAAADDRLPSEAPLSLSRSKGARLARETIFPRLIRPISGISRISAEVAAGPIPGALDRMIAVLWRLGSDTMNVRNRSCIS